MQARPSQPPDLIASIRLLPEQRAQFVSDGIATGFRAAHDFHHPDKELNDALHFVVGRDFLPLGEEAKSEMWLLVPERNAGRLYPGLEFSICAGARVVGNGRVVEIINHDLTKKT